MIAEPHNTSITADIFQINYSINDYILIHIYIGVIEVKIKQYYT